MKKTIFAALILLTLLASGQARINFTPYELKTEFADHEQKFDRTDEGTLYLAVYFPYMVGLYYFNDDNNSYATAIIPYDTKSLNALIEKYDRDYAIIDNHHWKSYQDGTILHCELYQLNDGTYYFMCTEFDVE